MAKLTPGRLFTLKQLAKRPMTGNEVSREAIREGLNNRPNGAFEWADAHLKWLRDNGYATYTGRRILGSHVHDITDLGRGRLAFGAE